MLHLMANATQGSEKAINNLIRALQRD